METIITFVRHNILIVTVHFNKSSEKKFASYVLLLLFFDYEARMKSLITQGLNHFHCVTTIIFGVYILWVLRSYFRGYFKITFLFLSFHDATNGR